MLEFKYEAYKEKKPVYSNELALGAYSGTIQSAGFFTSVKKGTSMYSMDILLDNGQVVKHGTSTQYLRSMQRIIQDLVQADDSERIQSVFSLICGAVFKRKEKNQFVDLKEDLKEMVSKNHIHEVTKSMLEAQVKEWCDKLKDDALVAMIAKTIVANQALIFKAEDLERLSETGALAEMLIPISFTIENYFDAKKGENKHQMRREKVGRPAIAPTEVASAPGDDEIPF